MASFSVLSKEEMEQELSPEEIEARESCNSEDRKEVNSPFANLLTNLLSGGGRERQARVRGNFIKLHFVLMAHFVKLSRWRTECR